MENVNYTTQYVWDEANLLVETIYPSGRRVKNFRDTVGRLNGVKRTNAGGGVINTYVSNVTYQAGTGLLSQVTLADNTREEFTFSSQRFQLTNKKVIKTTNGNTLFEVTYNYQASAGQAGPQAGNVGQIISTTDSQQPPESYTYDYLARLKTEATAGVNYTYDRWGNMTQISGPGYTEFAQVQTDGQGNPTNRYATINGYTQVYDAAGNLTDDATYLYKYDAAGRMREVYQKAGNILLQKFWYDHAGQRMKKEDRPIGSTAHWYYCVWSGNQVIAEFQALVGTTFNPGTTPEQAAGTDTLADLRYQHTDIRSVRLITDGTGLQVDTQAHTPHGGVVDGGGQARTFFTTYEREMSGLDYARARYYRSNHRRFTSADPYGGSYRQGNPQSLNRYAYVANDPTNRVDPSGAVATLVESAMDLEKGELHASVMSVEQDRCNLDEIRRAAQKAKELYPNHACYAMIETIKFAFLECGRNRIDQAMLYLLGTFTGPNAVPFGQIGFQRKFWDSNFPDNPTIDQVHHFIAWFYFGFTSNPVVKSLGFRNLLNDITERNAGDIRLSGYGSYYGLLLRSLVNNPNATQSDIYDLVFKIQETLCAGD